MLVTTPVLAHPNDNKEYTLYTNASHLVLGAILVQTDEERKKHVIEHQSTNPLKVIQQQEVCTLYDCKAESIALFIVNNIIGRHGCPKEIVSDQGTYFNNKTIKSLCQSLGIKHIMLSSYHLQTNKIKQRLESIKSQVQRIATTLNEGKSVFIEHDWVTLQTTTQKVTKFILIPERKTMPKKIKENMTTYLLDLDYEEPRDFMLPLEVPGETWNDKLAWSVLTEKGCCYNNGNGAKKKIKQDLTIDNRVDKNGTKCDLEAIITEKGGTRKGIIESIKTVDYCDRLEHAIFSNQLDVRKLGRIFLE
ncbi:2096_t:CDS:2, partial [Gigaspora margarita]